MKFVQDLATLQWHSFRQSLYSHIHTCLAPAHIQHYQRRLDINQVGIHVDQYRLTTPVKRFEMFSVPLSHVFGIWMRDCDHDRLPGDSPAICSISFGDCVSVRGESM
jgi:hypothetical protein